MRACSLLWSVASLRDQVGLATTPLCKIKEAPLYWPEWEKDIEGQRGRGFDEWILLKLLLFLIKDVHLCHFNWKRWPLPSVKLPEFSCHSPLQSWELKIRCWLSENEHGNLKKHSSKKSKILLKALVVWFPCEFSGLVILFSFLFFPRG